MLVALWAGAAVLAVLAWRLPDPRAAMDDGSTGIANVASWIIPAVVGPLALYPLALTPSSTATALLAVLWPLSTLPLALTLGGLMRRYRLAARGFSVVAAVVAGVLGLLPLVTGSSGARTAGGPVHRGLGDRRRTGHDPACHASVRGPGDRDLLVEPGHRPGHVRRGRPRPRARCGHLHPAVGHRDRGTRGRDGGHRARGPARRPAARPARSRAPTSSATSSWRPPRRNARRVAADIHDDAAPGADPAGPAPRRRRRHRGRRHRPDGVATALRGICGDLRLPILDDLGVGPALDWLVLPHRAARRRRGPPRAVRRHPAAARRRARVLPDRAGGAGQRRQARPPPIVVRYRTTDAGAVALDRRRRARASSRDAGGARRAARATSASSTCSSGPRPSARSSTCAAGRPAGPTSRSSGRRARTDPRRGRRRPPRRRAKGPRRCSRSRPDIEIVGPGGLLDEARTRSSPTRRPLDVLLLDIRLGDESGLRPARRRADRRCRRSSCSPRTTTRSTPRRRCASARRVRGSRPRRLHELLDAIRRAAGRRAGVHRSGRARRRARA